MKILLSLALAFVSLSAICQTNGVPDQRLEDFVQIHNVLMEVAFIDGRYRPFPQRLSALEKVDVSKCPSDFRSAWAAFIKETASNFKIVKKKNSDVLAIEETTMLISFIEPGVADHLASRGLMHAAVPPDISQEASDRLKEIIKKYED